MGILGYTFTEEMTLTTMRCGLCGILFAVPDFAVPDFFYRERHNDGGNFFCPNGHCRVFREPEVKRLKRELEAASARAVHAEDQRKAAERQTAAYKGQVTKIRKRVGNGVCPCCNRSFTNLRRHMTAKHPDYKDATSETDGSSGR